MPFWEGIVLGAVLAILIGPVFFALIQTSIQKNTQTALLMALGIVLSDAAYIIIAYFGLATILNNTTFNLGLGLVGSIIMLAIGINSFFKKVHYNKEDKNFTKNVNQEKLKTILKGFMLNSMNPAVLIFWIGAVSYATIELKYMNIEAILFFTGTLGFTFTTDVVKIFVAKKISMYLNDTTIHRLNQAAGIGLFIFGLKLGYESLIPLFQ